MSCRAQLTRHRAGTPHVGPGIRTVTDSGPRACQCDAPAPFPGLRPAALEYADIPRPVRAPGPYPLFAPDLRGTPHFPPGRRIWREHGRQQSSSPVCRGPKDTRQEPTMADSVPVRCPTCRREVSFTPPTFPCACGAPLTMPVLRGGVPVEIVHRTWRASWVEVRCLAPAAGTTNGRRRNRAASAARSPGSPSSRRPSPPPPNRPSLRRCAALSPHRHRSPPPARCGPPSSRSRSAPPGTASPPPRSI